MRSLTRNPKPQIPPLPHPGATSPKCPHQLALFHSCSDHHELGIPPLILRQAEQLVSLHFRYTVTHTHIISAHFYTIRFQRRASNAHPRHSLENRIETAYHALGLSTSYPGPSTMPMSVALAKAGNRGKSYTTYLKPFVTAERI